MVNIEGLSVVDVLIALWDNSRSQGMSMWGQYSHGLNKEQAEEEIKATEGHLDYVNGRVIKCYLPFGATQFDEWGYDRDNGPGAAQRAVDSIMK